MLHHYSSILVIIILLYAPLLQNKIVEISENVETFLPLIEALNASLASQHLDISEAELRLTSLLQNIEELESL